jgi:hypothetical protein
MNAKILLTKTPDFQTFKEDMLAAGLAEEVPANDLEGGTKIQPVGTHTLQRTVWVDSNGNPTLPERDDDGNITNDAQKASHVYVLSLLTARAVQNSDYVSFDGEGDTIDVADIKTGFTVGGSEIIWDNSQDQKAPANLTSGWAGYDIGIAQP